MGYSELKCHICGVSFNIARIRTVGEPRTAAWSCYGTRDLGSDFVSLGEPDSCEQVECGEDSGCQFVYREYAAQKYREMTRPSPATEEFQWQTSKSLLNFPDEWSDNEDDSYEPESELTQADEMPEEYDSSYESDDKELSNENHESSTSAAKLEDIEHELYKRWTGKLSHDFHLMRNKFPTLGRHLSQCAEPPNERSLNEFWHSDSGDNVTIENEVRISFHPEQSSSENNRIIKFHGRNIGSLYSVQDYPRYEGEKFRRSPWWEHIAGPSCKNCNAYNGNQISSDEMLTCCTLQALAPKPKHWQADEYIEDWEMESSWYVSGLADFSPSRDTGWPQFFPNRLTDNTMVDNFDWGNDPDAKCAMPMHPACFEVFKRASTHLFGSIKFDDLGHWFTETNLEYSDDWLPPQEEIRNARDQWWQHNNGDEWLAADPCFVPELAKLIGACPTYHLSSSMPDEQEDLAQKLPHELWSHLLHMLDKIDIAKACIAIPSLQEIGHTILLDKLKQDMPFLWELWSDAPYSKWAGIRAAEVEEAITSYEIDVSERAAVLQILQEEGHEEARVACQNYWTTNEHERKEKLMKRFAEKPVSVLDPEKGHLAHFFIKLQEARNAGQLKGLKNRERIWGNCCWILDKISGVRSG